MCHRLNFRQIPGVSAWNVRIFPASFVLDGKDCPLPEAPDDRLPPPLECHAELMITAFDHTQSFDPSATRLLTILFFSNGRFAPLLLSHAGKAALNKSVCRVVRQACPEPRRRDKPERTRRAHRTPNQPLASRPGSVEEFGHGFLKGPRPTARPHGAKHGSKAAQSATARCALLRGRHPPGGVFRAGQQTTQESGASQEWA